MTWALRLTWSLGAQTTPDSVTEVTGYKDSNPFCLQNFSLHLGRKIHFV